MKFKSGVVVGILLAAAFFTNPSKEDHAKKLAEATLGGGNQAGGDTALSRIGSAFAQSFSDSLFDYHNYYLFSTTTSPGGDRKLTIGVLGNVMIQKQNDNS